MNVMQMMHGETRRWLPNVITQPTTELKRAPLLSSPVTSHYLYPVRRPHSSLNFQLWLNQRLLTRLGPVFSTTHALTSHISVLIKSTASVFLFYWAMDGAGDIGYMGRRESEDDAMMRRKDGSGVVGCRVSKIGV